MRADDGDQTWAYDNEAVHTAIAEYRRLELERREIVRRQAELRGEIKGLRLEINEEHVVPLVEGNLSDLMDLYRATLYREGMDWTGRLEVGVLSLWADNRRVAFQAEGMPWCFIKGTSQIEWAFLTEDGMSSTRHLSPEITPEMVFAHCERLGMEVVGWGAQMQMDVGVSLVVNKLVEAGQGTSRLHR